MNKTKKEYNKTLARYHKATEYFECPETPRSSKEKFLNDFYVVLDTLNWLLHEIGDYTQEQVLKGFQI